jgi:hypothetical protein
VPLEGRLLVSGINRGNIQQAVSKHPGNHRQAISLMFIERMTKKQLEVTRPFLPPLHKFIPYLEGIWQSRVLTNCGSISTSD